MHFLFFTPGPVLLLLLYCTTVLVHNGGTVLYVLTAPGHVYLQLYEVNIMNTRHHFFSMFACITPDS